MSQADVLNAHGNFKKNVIEARHFEVKNIGNDPLGSIEYYDKANVAGFDLFYELDVTKVEDLDNALKKSSRVFTAKNIVLSIITGSIVALLSGLYFCDFWEEFINLFRLLTESIVSFVIRNRQ